MVLPEVRDILSIRLVADILQNVVGIPTDQIWFYNQKQDIPKDDKTYFVVGLKSIDSYGSGGDYDRSRLDTPMAQDVDWLCRENVFINVFSRSLEAMYYLPYVIASFNSQYAVTSQETNGYKIATLPREIRDQTLEFGPAIIYNYIMIVPLLRGYQISNKDIDYYDTFSHSFLEDTNI
jgi:hypothetical protein